MEHAWKGQGGITSSSGAERMWRAIYHIISMFESPTITYGKRRYISWGIVVTYPRLVFACRQAFPARDLKSIHNHTVG
jgi:hypothetical protein